jgi:hypothetical protein
MLINLVLALAGHLAPGIAETICLVMRLARCNDRIRRPIPGTMT